MLRFDIDLYQSVKTTNYFLLFLWAQDVICMKKSEWNITYYYNNQSNNVIAQFMAQTMSGECEELGDITF